MPKSYNRYTLIRYIIDAPVVGLSYLMTLHFSNLQSTIGANLNDYLFTFILLSIWYIATGVSRLYKDRRSNKFSEEIIFIMYTLIIFTILLSSVSFFLRHYFRFNAYFFRYRDWETDRKSTRLNSSH